MPPDVDAWDAWLPSQLADRMAGSEVRWYVAGGWALELFHGGTPSRDHDDLEFAVPDDQFALVAQRFPDFEFYVAGGGGLAPATAENLSDTHQTWALEIAAGLWRFDVFREPRDGDTWVYRRDERIRRPYAEVVQYARSGVPYLAPEIVLLFKAKSDRPKDRADLRHFLPLLGTARRAWLAAALDVAHPGHYWHDIVAPE
jgi:hypothetical protein